MMTTASTPFGDHVEAAFDLGDHAAGDGAVLDQLLRLGRGQRLDQVAVLVEHALDVGQQQQALRLDRRGERRGEGVGVDVERLAVRRRRRSARSPGSGPSG